MYNGRLTPKKRLQLLTNEEKERSLQANLTECRPSCGVFGQSNTNKNKNAMPLPLIAAALPLIGQGIDAAVTGGQNRKSREFSREMYERTKTDNLAFWDQQNKYNAPQAQMQRLKDAGLNPNLIYGGSGNSGQAASIPTPDVQSAQFRGTDFAGAAAQSANNLAEFQNMDIRQATYDNLMLQGSVLKQEAVLKAAQVGATTAATARSQFDLDFASELRNTSADFLRTQVDKMKADYQFTLSQTELNAAKNSSDLAEAAERILTMRFGRTGMGLDQEKTRQLIKGIKTDNAIKALDLKFYKEGIPPGSPFYMKTLATIVERLTRDLAPSPGLSPKQHLKSSLTDSMNDFFKRNKIK